MATVEKIDLKREHKAFYKPSKKDFSIVDVPEMAFLMIDGVGAPASPDFALAVETLYGVAYALKFASKADPGIDYVVMPLEALWWAEDFAVFQPDSEDRDAWHWRALIAQPDHISEAMFETAVEKTRTKKGNLALDRLRLERFHEGLSVQIMYIGPYSDEGPTIAAMHQYAEDEGYSLRDHHHEIYISDPNRTTPEKMKTVLRHPVE